MRHYADSWCYDYTYLTFHAITKSMEHISNKLSLEKLTSDPTKAVFVSRVLIIFHKNVKSIDSSIIFFERNIKKYVYKL